jgi:hypothetical protein
MVAWSDRSIDEDTKKFMKVDCWAGTGGKYLKIVDDAAKFWCAQTDESRTKAFLR